MPHEYGPETSDRICPHHARILGLLADDLTEREVAQVLAMTEDGVKSAVERLKQAFDCKNVRELRRTWRAVRADYVAYEKEVSGM